MGFKAGRWGQKGASAQLRKEGSHIFQVWTQPEKPERTFVGALAPGTRLPGQEAWGTGVLICQAPQPWPREGKPTAPERELASSVRLLPEDPSPCPALGRQLLAEPPGRWHPMGSVSSWPCPSPVASTGSLIPECAETPHFMVSNTQHQAGVGLPSPLTQGSSALREHGQAVGKAGGEGAGTSRPPPPGAFSSSEGSGH